MNPSPAPFKRRENRGDFVLSFEDQGEKWNRVNGGHDGKGDESEEYHGLNKEVSR